MTISINNFSMIKILKGWIEVLLTLILLENVNIIGNGNWFGPMEPAYLFIK